MNSEEKSMEQGLNILKVKAILDEELSIKKIEDIISTVISTKNPTSSQDNESLWSNLIFIEVSFSIENFVFKEELLWDRKRRSANEVKQFAIELIKEKVIDEKKCCLMKGIRSFTFEHLERMYYHFIRLVTAEYITKNILMDIQFYERFRPFYLIQSGIFGMGCGFNQGEHLITIDLDIIIGEKCYKEEIIWDILSTSFSPEDFALHIVSEMSLSHEFIRCISYEIRRQIRNYVFDLFKFVGKKIQLKASDIKVKPKTKSNRSRSTKKGSNNNNKAIITPLSTYLYDNKLSILLGKKTKRNVNNDELISSLNVKSIEIKNKEIYCTCNEGLSKEIKKKQTRSINNNMQRYNPNILQYDCKHITISKCIFVKEKEEEERKKPMILIEANTDCDLMFNKEDKECLSNSSSQSNTKSTSPKAKQILVLKSITNNEIITIEKC